MDLEKVINTGVDAYDLIRDANRYVLLGTKEQPITIVFELTENNTKFGLLNVVYNNPRLAGILYEYRDLYAHNGINIEIDGVVKNVTLPVYSKCIININKNLDTSYISNVSPFGRLPIVVAEHLLVSLITSIALTLLGRISNNESNNESEVSDLEYLISLGFTKRCDYNVGSYITAIRVHESKKVGRKVWAVQNIYISFDGEIKTHTEIANSKFYNYKIIGKILRNNNRLSMFRKYLLDVFKHSEYLGVTNTYIDIEIMRVYPVYDNDTINVIRVEHGGNNGLNNSEYRYKEVDIVLHLIFKQIYRIAYKNGDIHTAIALCKLGVSDGYGWLQLKHSKRH